MKSFFKFHWLGLLFLLTGFQITQSDNTCRVLLQEISSLYIGDCKGGLAHGFGYAEGEDRYEGNFRNGRPHGSGLYVWNNGDAYEGRWRKGARHGPGTFFDAEKDSVIVAYWKRGKYFRPDNEGEDQIAYSVVYRRNVTRYRFQRIGDGEEVFLKIGQPSEDRAISQVSAFANTGHYVVHPNRLGFEKASFPFQGRISFMGPSKTGTVTYLIEMQFEIHQPGSWEVTIFY